MTLYWLMDREMKRARAKDGVSPKPEEISSDALGKLIEFIPAETIALYITAVSIFPSLSGVWPQINANSIYVGFIIINIVLAFLFYLATYRKKNPSSWPPKEDYKGITFWWGLIASTIAFACWALAMPDSPFVGTNGVLKPVFGFVAVFSAIILSLIDSIIKPKAD